MLVTSSAGSNKPASPGAEVHSYIDAPLDTISTITAAGVSLHVRTRDRGEALCDLRLSRSWLRAALARADEIAELADTREMPALATEATN